MRMRRAITRVREAAARRELFASAKWTPSDADKLTRARGRRWLLFWHGRLGIGIDRALVRFIGWSPVYWLFAHRNAQRLVGTPILLHTLGRVSGQVRTVVLPAFAFNGSWLVCGTAAGSRRNPRWVLNIGADPRASIHLRRHRINVTARILADDERRTAATRLSLIHPSLDIYQAMADRYGRTIPIVELTPTVIGDSKWTSL